MLRHKPLYLVCFFLQFVFIFASGVRDTLSFVARGYTAVPVFFQAPANKAETILSASLGGQMDPVHPLRQAISVYTRWLGSNRAVLARAECSRRCHKLVSELHYLTAVSAIFPRFQQQRRCSFGRIAGPSDDTRLDGYAVIIKMVAYTVWQPIRTRRWSGRFSVSLLPGAGISTRNKRD